MFGVFSNGLFAHNIPNPLVEWFFACFWHFWFLTQLTILQKLSKMADFQNCLISRIFSVFSSGFLHTTTLMFLHNSIFHFFKDSKFLTQISHSAKPIPFAWAIGYARWLIFKILSFLEYLVFFRAVFCTEQL